MSGTFDFYSTRFVNGERVCQAREMAAMTQSDLALRVNVSQPMVAHIEKGLKQPSLELAEAIARETRVSLDFLCQPSGPSLPEGSLLFRARANVSAKKLNQAHAFAERVFEMYVRMSKHFDLPAPKLKPVQGSPQSAAIAARKILGLPPGHAVPHLIRAFEKAGGVVLTIPELDGREAFAVWAADRPVVALGPTLHGDRLRFSVAHEIGHLMMHQAPTAKTKAEKDAHLFAAELLLPAVSIAEDLESAITIERLGRLKQKWGVAMSALLQRAKELGVISRRNHYRLIREMAHWRKAEPAEYAIPIEKPRALRQMAEYLYGNAIDYEQVSKEFDLPSSFVREVFQRYASLSETGSSSRDTKVVNINAYSPSSKHIPRRN